MPGKAWPDAAIGYLRMRWADGASAAVVGEELTAQFGQGRVYSATAVANKANRMELPTRRIDYRGVDAAAFAELRRQGLSNVAIAKALDQSTGRVHYRARVMIAHGLIISRDRRHPLALVEPTPSAPERVPEALALRIRRLRMSRRLTQKQLAEQVGCYPGVVALWELAEAIPSPAIQQPLAVALRVSTEVLLTGYEHPLHHAIRVTRR